MSQNEASIASFEAVESDDDSDDELQQLKSMNPKQQLALTIKNWSDLVIDSMAANNFHKRDSYFFDYL